MAGVDAQELLRVLHEQVRLRDRDVAPGWTLERVGKVRRSYADDGSGQGFAEAPEGLDDPEAEIAAEVAFFTARGQAFEWKTYDYDEPADLPQRLTAAGFVAEDPESLILGEIHQILEQPLSLPSKVRIREVTTTEDFDRIEMMQTAVWGEGHGSFLSQLQAELLAAPDLLDVYLVEEAAGGPALCAAWVRYHPGTDFASLWGGSTLPEWRRQGLYRALLLHRARKAADRGYRYIRVDASEDSRPILQRVGLLRVATTTPYVFTP
jgi:ribosomal protein S18 acetylase RimI-like enzyme